MKDPTTLAEWQEAVDLVYWLISLDKAKDYGMINGMFAIDVNRCHQILKDGAKQGIYGSRKPTP